MGLKYYAVCIGNIKVGELNAAYDHISGYLTDETQMKQTHLA